MTDGSRVWAVKGVSDHTRDAAREAAQAAGLAIGDWIDRALAKIDGGTYGLCDDCGVAIGADRLRALPAASRCVDCARRA